MRNVEWSRDCEISVVLRDLQLILTTRLYRLQPINALVTLVLLKLIIMGDSAPTTALDLFFIARNITSDLLAISDERYFTSDSLGWLLSWSQVLNIHITDARVECPSF